MKEILIMEDEETWGGWENATILETTDETYHLMIDQHLDPKQLGLWPNTVKRAWKVAKGQLILVGYGLWDHPDIGDWQDEVSRGDTLRSFREWLEHREEVTR